MSLRVLIVDDSPFIRRILSDWIKDEPDLRVIGTAGNGQEGIDLAKELKPDVITMDFEMPKRDGLSALEEIMRVQPTPVIMVSSHTVQGAQVTMKALELGALDFVTKPQGATSLKFLGSRDELLAKLRASRVASLRTHAPISSRPAAVRGTTDKVVVVASSTGGPRALATFFESLPKGFPAPILLVQHMPSGFTESLAKRLNSIGTVPCKEAAEGDRVVPGMALLAPGGKHMTVGKDGVIHLNEEPSIHGVRPAADYLFKSAAAAYGRRCVGLVMTGMGKDGAEGALELKKLGCTVFGESESSCTIYGMPRAAKEIGAVKAEYPIGELASVLTNELGCRLANAS